MVDINLGNKTMVFGVLITLILSYGMVNAGTGVRKVSAAVPMLHTSTTQTGAEASPTRTASVQATEASVGDSDRLEGESQHHYRSRMRKLQQQAVASEEESSHTTPEVDG